MGRADVFVALVLGAVALALRREGLAPDSLWLDDAWVAVASSKAGWDQVLSFGSMSPGFTLLLRPFIAVGGESALAAQLVPLAAGVVAPGLLYVALVDRRLRRLAALVPATLLLSAPVHVTYSVFVKQYTFEVLLSIALLWSAWTIVDDGYSRRRWARLLAVACSGFAISAPVWPVIAVAVGVAGWAAWRRGDDRRWAAATGAGAAAFGAAWTALVILPLLNDLLHDYWASSYIDTNDGLGDALTSTVDRLQAAIGGLAPVERRAALAGVALAAIVVLWRRTALALLLLGPLAIAVGLAAAELAPIGTGRTDMYLYPPVLMVVGLALDTVADRLPRRAATSLLAVALLAACIASVGVDQEPYPREEVRALVEVLESERRPGDVSLVYPMASFAFALYSDEAVELVPSSDYATGWSVSVPDADVHVLPNRMAAPGEYEPIVRDAVLGRDRVWFLSSHSRPDADEIRRLLGSLGFTLLSTDRRPGALLDLWVREDGEPPAT